MSTVIKEKGPQTVTVKLEATFKLGENVSFMDAMSAAETLIEVASQGAVGEGRGEVPRTVTGTIVIGRQKFALN